MASCRQEASSAAHPASLLLPASAEGETWPRPAASGHIMSDGGDKPAEAPRVEEAADGISQKMVDRWK